MKVSKKILVIDDDQGILQLLQAILEEASYKVKTLANGKAVQKKVKDYHPDLILMDIWMPGIGGREMTMLLKRDKETKDIPIIILSALNETKKIAEEVGADDFLPKPFDIKDLLKKVKSQLD